MVEWITSVCRMLQQQNDELKLCHQRELEASHNKLMQMELALRGSITVCVYLTHIFLLTGNL